ncbi:helix-turn-helix domain-containing protein [Carboxydothermus hydrogenoformans]|uniref:DNA-binding protein n=1 Tax=Carboxydothermus hydrogenoformans (strain ATCC BAA-161 / DSM 6008 / Z-2901) TaxID=246194 RepID=Q3AB02_CARHZ|nr:helix-turn-helix transcriptional regulator [Carboxydothermus hydrogenoformans]ABB14635.1 DNA-binding protein [Carboxydothermus hydrogenoformans Z-2901]
MEINTKAIGQRIREEREKLELSREEFAEILGLSDYYVGQLERGERQMSLPVLVNIAQCLHVSLDYLIFGSTPFEPSGVQENISFYNFLQNLDPELLSLLSKCSHDELELFKKLIKTILPYLGKKPVP